MTLEDESICFYHWYLGKKTEINVFRCWPFALPAPWPKNPHTQKSVFFANRDQLEPQNAL